MDAIVGTQSLMHTVVESWCIGCGLCPPACPVDCIDMVAPRGEWTEALKRAAGKRARRRKARIEGIVFHKPQDRKKLLADKSVNLATRKLFPATPETIVKLGVASRLPRAEISNRTCKPMTSNERL